MIMCYCLLPFKSFNHPLPPAALINRKIKLLYIKSNPHCRGGTKLSLVIIQILFHNQKPEVEIEIFRSASLNELGNHNS
jgi:hypothetical protein